MSVEIELLLIEHLHLVLATRRGDREAASAATTALVECAQRLLPRLEESPLQRQRLRTFLPDVQQTVQDHGDAAQLATLTALARAIAD